MSVQRKRYSADLKTRVALEAIKGQKTANEIAAEYGVHPTQIAQWKNKHSMACRRCSPRKQANVKKAKKRS